MCFECLKPLFVDGGYTGTHIGQAPGTCLAGRCK